MKKFILVALAVLMLIPASAAVAQRGGGGHGGGGGGSHGGGGGGSHGGGSGGSGGWHGGGGSGGGGWHGGGGSGGWHGGGHGHYGYGGHGGYYYYPPLYPYWGWGWGVGWGYGWDAGWGWGLGWGPYGFYGYNSYNGPRYGYGNGSDWGVVDTDVSPEEARVFLDGRYIGIADDFDGSPDYLYLRPGTYNLEFRLEGYEPVTVTVNAKPGSKVDLKNKLVKIAGAKQYGSYETPPPEGGLQRYWGKKRDGTDEALDNSRHDRYSEPNEVEATPDGAHYAPPPPPPPNQGDLRQDEWRQSRPRHGARLLMMIKPDDAAVYLDDRFIGTAAEVGGVDQAVPLAPGKHTVTVSRPGFKDKTVEVEVLAGEVKRVDVALER